MLIVQKYGGTSVGTLERIDEVAKRVIQTKEQGNSLVVVVSAMSGVTNRLLEYADHFSKNPSKRETDLLLSAGERVTSALLAIALNELGHQAVAFSGRQAGMITDSFHTKARISQIYTPNIENALKDGKIVVVAGFQGVDENGDVTTLGRGGSDLSAVALAGALKADLCEIYTDVDGVYTTDPRIEPKAKKLDKISYDEMLELASLGAKVLQNRSVELAKKLNINLVTRSSFNNHEGTLITGEESMEGAIISGIALDKNQARVTIREVNELDTAVKALKEILPNLSIESDNNIVKVSIVGVGMKSHSGVAAKAFSTLADNGINIQMISTSEIKISMIVDAKYAELAVRILHEVYHLDK